jgi:uncharacterized protein YdhG (YjbR/CyaY superfamily)
MQYSVTTPDEYLKAIDDDWRKEKLLQIREMILNNGTNLQEGIEYKMLCYGYPNKKFFHLNAQSAYVSLYIGDISKVKNYETLLKPFSIGKGCIRIKKSLNLSETELNEFIKKVIEKNKNGENTDC